MIEFMNWLKGSISDNWKKGFHEVLPYEKIQKWLAAETPKIKSCFE